MCTSSKPPDVPEKPEVPIKNPPPVIEEVDVEDVKLKNKKEKKKKTRTMLRIDRTVSGNSIPTNLNIPN